MSPRDTLTKVWSEGTFVHLTLEDGGHDGFVLAIGADLVLIQAIHEFQDVGALVVPIDLIEDCEVSDHARDQMKILDFNSVKRTKRYGWVRINSLAALFKSLQAKAKFVVLSAADDSADVGLVDAVENDLVVVKAIDPGGNWLADEIEWPFDDIRLVQFDDSYSRTLQRYAEKQAQA
jgi:hypothetical protein